MNSLIEAARELAGREAAYREAYDICGATSAEAGRRRDRMAKAGNRVRAALKDNKDTDFDADPALATITKGPSI